MVTELTMLDMVQGVHEVDELLRIVMFYGTTCGPCKNTMPHYETVAKYFVDKNSPILFYRINAWEPFEQKQYCESTWEIQGVPHFKAFILGNEIHSVVGFSEEEKLMKFLQECIDLAFKYHGIRI